MYVVKKRGPKASFSILPQFYSTAFHLIAYFGEESVGTGLQFKFYIIAALLEEQFSFHRIDSCFLHLSGGNHQSILAEANSKIISAFCSLRYDYSC